MVAILKYVLLGCFIYILVIPVLEQVATLVCQALENLKGKLIYKQAILQQQIDDLKEPKSSVNAIGFSIPIEEEEEYEE